jgi:hypothetical protein
MFFARARLVVCSLAVVALLAAGVTAAPTTTAAFAAPAPQFDPSNFNGHAVDNPWFPLTPGTTLVYTGTKDGKKGSDIFRVTGRTRIVGDVRATVVDDTLVLAGLVREHTLDWYAQDRDGNVWYPGERTAEFDAKGNVTSTEGSWETGVHGATPGIFMPAHPHVGDTYRQEYYPGHAEDHFTVTNTDASISVPYGTFSHALRTREWTPLEPGTRDAKFYAKGIGEVAEITVVGPREVFRLAQVIHR